MDSPKPSLKVFEILETTIASKAEDPDDGAHFITIKTTVSIHGNPGKERMNREIMRHAERVASIETK